MKFAIFTLLVIILVVTVRATLDEEKQKVKKWSSECRTETQVSAESLQKLHNNRKTDDPRLKEYVLCTVKKLGFMNENDDWNIEKIRDLLQVAGSNGAKIEQLINTCAVKKHRPEETAYEAVLCWYRNKSLP